MGDISARLSVLQERIQGLCERAGRSDAVALVAVSKTVDVARIHEAFAAGQRLFGENKVQEAVGKIAGWSELDRPEWHFLGHLQTNKIRPMIMSFQYLQSLDSRKLAIALDARAIRQSMRMPVLLEVNVAGEESKSGFSIDEVKGAARDLAALPGLDLRGLMTVAPAADDPEDIRWVFRTLRETRDAIRDTEGLSNFSQLSMGMSGDYPVAIQEGATMIRIGRALFGERYTASMMGLR